MIVNMSKEELASWLDGREYGRELSRLLQEHSDLWKKEGLVVVVGYSDDNVEFYGAIHDEVGAYDGAEIQVDHKGIVPECECECRCRKCDNPHPFKSHLVSAKWGTDEYCWFINSEIPHASFDILDNELDDGMKFCRGIVFNISDL